MEEEEMVMGRSGRERTEERSVGAREREMR